MGISNPWDEMTVDEKLETLRHDMESHQRQSSRMTKAVNELRRRVEEIERRLEDLMLD
jgi:predicted  nucleic acid-binding Zn-ribbon protein